MCLPEQMLMHFGLQGPSNLVNAVTGEVGNGTALIAVAEWRGNYLELILKYHVADSVSRQHLHNDAVVLKNANQIPDMGDVFGR